MPHTPRLRSSAAFVLPLAAALTLSGCSMGPLAKHTAVFSAATNTLIDRSTTAYRAAETLHDDAEGYQAVAHFDRDPPYNPYKDAKPLITEDGLAVRAAVLDGIKTYAQRLSDLSNGVKSDQLDAAAAGVGSKLQAMSATLSTQIAASTGATNKLTLSDTESKAVSTAADALGRFLIARKLKHELLPAIRDNRDNITALCVLLQKDIEVLRNQSGLDYEIMVQDQDSFIRHSTTLTPLERRGEILKLPRLVASQRATDAILAQLGKLIVAYNLTYQALAAEAQGNNPTSLQGHIAELTALAQDLATFYSSLPASTTLIAHRSAPWPRTPPPPPLPQPHLPPRWTPPTPASTIRTCSSLSRPRIGTPPAWTAKIR